MVTEMETQKERKKELHWEHLKEHCWGQPRVTLREQQREQHWETSKEHCWVQRMVTEMET